MLPKPGMHYMCVSKGDKHHQGEPKFYLTETTSECTVFDRKGNTLSGDILGKKPKRTFSRPRCAVCHREAISVSDSSFSAILPSPSDSPAA